MILLVDNYDSFTWNLYQSMAGQGAQVEVRRNDAITVDEILAMQPSGLVISPGPGRPADAGITPQLFAAMPEHLPMLGVCLGHQALCEHYGAELEVDPKIRRQDRRRAKLLARRGESLAAMAIMASARQRIHVVQRPDHGVLVRNGSEKRWIVDQIGDPM